MKTLRILFLALFLVSFSTSNANEFPWEKYGFDPDIVTLSKGKYQEFHDLKTIVEIGSVLYNTQTKKIVGFTEQNALNTEASIKPHIASRWISADPLSEEYSSWSPYNYTMNNPILFIDPNGMAVDYSELYKQDDEGNYINETQIKAFEAFAMTENGQKYIMERAQEGFELTGVFEKDLSLKADNAGALDESGIDVAFSVADLDDTAFGSANGVMGMDVENNRLKLNVTLDENTNNVFELAETISHETFYHGDIYEKSFLNLSIGQRTKENIWSKNNTLHRVPIHNTKYGQIGPSHLQNIQRVLGLKNINSQNYLWYNVMLPSFGWNKRDDIIN